MIEYLDTLDRSLLLAMNGSESIFLDGVMKVITTTWVWIPMFVVLSYVLLKNNSPKSFLLTLVAIALTVVVCDQVASGICKPLFQRFRPTQDPHIMYLIDVVDGYRGGRYGFISSHAANTFGITVFLSLLFRRTSFTIPFCCWAVLSSYSRIYLGVHYPGDILCGGLVGCLSGLLMYLLYVRILRLIKENSPQRRASALYTPTGYLVSDLNLLVLTLLLTYAIIPVIGICMMG